MMATHPVTMSQENKSSGNPELQSMKVKGLVTDEATVSPNMNNAWLALSRFRRRKYASTAELCTQELQMNPTDEAMWFLKARALTMSVYVDDTDVDQEGIGDVLLDSNAMASAPRPGTSLRRPLTNAQGGGGMLRPTSQSGRPVTGFARPGTQGARPGTRSGGGIGGRNDLATAMRSAGRPGTSRPVSVAGRFLRPGTASLITGNGGDNFIQVERLNLGSFVKRPALAKALMDYLIYHEHNPRKALELASQATEAAGFSDWWWKQRLGKVYYLLGMMREAEEQFRSALRQQESIGASLELAKIFYRLDQPNAALAVYGQALVTIGDPVFAIGTARVHEALGDIAKSTTIYQQVLQMDQSNIESIACLAANYFYNDQPEIALRFYRRLVQMGVTNAEIFNNLGLCCFYSNQYDMALGCFERALAVADDVTTSDIWYNIGQVAIGLGDVVCYMMVYYTWYLAPFLSLLISYCFSVLLFLLFILFISVYESLL